MSIRTDEPSASILRIGLDWGIDDYVPLINFFLAADEVLGVDNYVTVEILGPIFDFVVDEGIAVPGTLMRGFHEWTMAMSNEEVKERIRRHLVENGNDRVGGFEFWLRCTEVGLDYLRSVPLPREPVAD